MKNLKVPNETYAFHITFWHDFRNELIGVTYKVKTIQEALNVYISDSTTPNTDRIKYILAIDDPSFKP
tara:strand:- start:4116 stop:4319 length:204 start_codon:yes stop_codon:yes gene_type:complete